MSSVITFGKQRLGSFLILISKTSLILQTWQNWPCAGHQKVIKVGIPQLSYLSFFNMFYTYFSIYYFNLLSKLFILGLWRSQFASASETLYMVRFENFVKLMISLTTWPYLKLIDEISWHRNKNCSRIFWNLLCWWNQSF